MSLNTEKLRLRIYIGIFCGVLLLGTFGYMATEDLTFIDALYFTIVTIATVGYGDIVPSTPLGKLLDVVLIITGVGTFVGLVANVTEIYIKKREQEIRQQKLQMLIGLYFSECGNRLLQIGCACDADRERLQKRLQIDTHWDDQAFKQAEQFLQSHPHHITPQGLDLQALYLSLTESRDFIPRLLESPYILEHEHFTNLLIAVLHLREELMLRDDLSNLPESDLIHLAGDLQRIQKLQGLEWLNYLKELKKNYPFLYSLAIRNNPFLAERHINVTH